MWRPQRVMFESKALEFSHGKRMYDNFCALGIPVETMGPSRRVTGIPASPPTRAWTEAKNTLVVRVRNTRSFETCKPSAHYQLPLASSCPGKCEYCYLHTTLGKKPYLRAYANLDEILHRAEQYIQERMPESTVFEGAATSDPVPLEPYTGSLARTIEFFGQQKHARFRFVTKFTQVDSLLNLEHNHHTRFRFSLNTPMIIRAWEHGTPDLTARLEAVSKVTKAGYPVGIIIAPVVLMPDWEHEYSALLNQMKHQLEAVPDLTLEIILHRFTDRAKALIQDIFPQTTLPMDKAERIFKYGQFGYGKYVYSKELYTRARDFFERELPRQFPSARLEYLV